jgi:uncharacterized integral membrane protein (TIGR00698 family)
MHRFRLLPGLALTAAIALLATALGATSWFMSHGLSALTIAIVLGIVLGNTIYPRLAPQGGEGVAFSKQTLLRAGVVLYGLRLTLHDIGHVGVAGVVIDALVILTTFGLAQALGHMIGLDHTSRSLIGAGSAICGAAAVMATEPVVRARPEQVAVAVSTVVVFGTLSMFLYPALYTLNLHWSLLPTGADAFGVYAGSTIHEVAQVVAAGRQVSADTANTAVITKLVRVMMLAPFLIGLSAWLMRGKASVAKPSADATAGTAPVPVAAQKLPVPWFAFGFIAVVVFNSLALLPQHLVSEAIQLDTLLLAMAMGALGLCTHIGAVRQAGFKPLLLAGMLFVWLIVGGGSINRLVAGWLS